MENSAAMPVRSVGLFNVAEEEKQLTFTPEQLGLTKGSYVLTVVWTGAQYPMTDSFAVTLESHGSRLLAVSKAEGVQLYDANVRIVSAEIQDLGPTW